MFPLYSHRGPDASRDPLEVAIVLKHPTSVTKVLFASDFHGQTSAYAGLVDFARARTPNAVVLGGDLLPFPNIGEDALEVQRRFVADELHVVLTTLAEYGVDAYAIHGNDDWAAALGELERLADEGWVRLIHKRSAKLAEGWSIAGLGLVPVTPFYMKDFDRRDHPGWQPAVEPPVVMLSDDGAVREDTLDTVMARPTIQEELAELVELSDPARTVYVVHTPPADCQLDVMHGGHHIGSQALRRFLEKHRPPYSLHGHVHESSELTGAIHDRVGPTLSVNPGASLMGFRGAWLDLETGTVEAVGGKSD